MNKETCIKQAQAKIENLLWKWYICGEEHIEITEHLEDVWRVGYAKGSQSGKEDACELMRTFARYMQYDYPEVDEMLDEVNVPRVADLTE